MSNGKVMIIHLIAGKIKKKLHKMSQYFPEPYESLEEISMSQWIYVIMQQKQL